MTTIVVVGGISPSARLSHDDGLLRIEGQLKDDRGAPLQGRVTIDGLVDRLFRTCRETGESSGSPAGQRAFSSDGEGHFCLISAGPPLPEVKLVAQAPNHRSVSFAAAPFFSTTPRTRVVRSPERILRGSSVQYTVEALLLSPGATTQSNTTLTLECGKSRQQLGKAVSVSGQLTRFEFSGSQVTGLGTCLLVVTATKVGSELQTSATSREAGRPVLVQAEAELALVNTENVSNDRTEALVVARTSRPGEIVDGILEARVDGAFEASCSLEEGSCSLSLERKAKARTVRISLLPGGDDWLASSPLSVPLPEREPSPFPTLAKALLIVAFGIWIARLWLGRRREPHEASPVAHGHAGVTQARTTKGHLHGTIIDTHTGEAITNATVTIFEVSPTGEHVLSDVKSDSSGAFTTRTHPTPERLLRVRVASEGYVSLDAIVVGSQLGIQLTSARRALLSSLLDWAASRGLPLRPRIPGPVEIAAHAEHYATTEEAQWARNTAKAAYCAQPPTESALASLSERQRR